MNTIDSVGKFCLLFVLGVGRLSLDGSPNFLRSALPTQQLVDNSRERVFML